MNASSSLSTTSITSSIPSTTSTIDCILDVDTGVDDAHALLLSIRHPRLNVLLVTTVNGNSEVETVTSATLRVLDAANAPLELPVAMGCDSPLVEPRHNCPQIHGYDSLGDLSDPSPLPPPSPARSRTVVSEHAVTYLKSMLEKRIATGERKITLIALAPLTNVAMLVRLAPDVVRKGVERIVWMGGATMGGGNATAWGEANAAYDPEAAHIVLSSCGVPLTMYSLDVYLTVAFGVEELVEYGCCRYTSKEKKEGQMANETENVEKEASNLLSIPLAVHQTTTPSWAQLSTRLLLRDMQHFSQTTAQIGDAGAVATLLAPSHAVHTRRLPVTVELKGERTRGMTVVDLREYVSEPDAPKEKPNVDVVVGVDAEILKAVFADAVLR